MSCLAWFVPRLSLCRRFSLFFPALGPSHAFTSPEHSGYATLTPPSPVLWCWGGLHFASAVDELFPLFLLTFFLFFSPIFGAVQNICLPPRVAPGFVSPVSCDCRLSSSLVPPSCPIGLSPRFLQWLSSLLCTVSSGSGRSTVPPVTAVACFPPHCDRWAPPH